jgi:hypothetical protein
LSGRNLLCDAGTNLCFNMSNTFKSYSSAQAECRAMTGELVQHTSAAKQLLVGRCRRCQSRSQPTTPTRQPAIWGLNG